MYVSDGGMKIKWVDDTHALGVFSTEAAGESFTVNEAVLEVKSWR